MPSNLNSQWYKPDGSHTQEGCDHFKCRTVSMEERVGFMFPGGTLKQKKLIGTP